MLTYTGTVLSVTAIPAKTDPKTGELIAERALVQILGKKLGPDGSTIAAIEDMKVDDPKPYQAAKGKQVRLMVRPWTYEGRLGLSVVKGAPVEVIG